MSAHIRLVPVEGVTELPDIPLRFFERPKKRSELILLNVTTILSVIVVSCAWILLALD
ncbi:MAG: hypothetical protein ABW198_11930 [Pseudorhodoplanes sp.]